MSAKDVKLGQDAREVAVFTVEIEKLTAVTDLFGERVRDAAAAEMAAKRQSETS